jgi:hypothetical protein
MALNPAALLPVKMVVITMMTDFLIIVIVSKACAMVRFFGGRPG